jgi:phage tail sheath protein FI
MANLLPPASGIVFRQPIRSFLPPGSTTAPPSTLVFANVRRLSLYIESSLNAQLQWVVFEPNAPTLWAAVRNTISSFLNTLFQQGALQGTTPSQAYFVTCDATTITPTDLANGVVNIVVGFAPIYPAEFVVIPISQFAAPASK